MTCCAIVGSTLFDKIRQSDAFKDARKKAMKCQQKFAPE